MPDFNDVGDKITGALKNKNVQIGALVGGVAGIGFLLLNRRGGGAIALPGEDEVPGVGGNGGGAGGFDVEGLRSEVAAQLQAQDAARAAQQGQIESILGVLAESQAAVSQQFAQLTDAVNQQLAGIVAGVNQQQSAYESALSGLANQTNAALADLAGQFSQQAAYQEPVLSGGAYDITGLLNDLYSQFSALPGQYSGSAVPATQPIYDTGKSGNFSQGYGGQIAQPGGAVKSGDFSQGYGGQIAQPGGGSVVKAQNVLTNVFNGLASVANASVKAGTKAVINVAQPTGITKNTPTIKTVQVTKVAQPTVTKLSTPTVKTSYPTIKPTAAYVAPKSVTPAKVASVAKQATTAKVATAVKAK